MRLASLILGSALVGANLHAAPELSREALRELPWASAYEPSWQPCDPGPDAVPLPKEAPCSGGLKVSLTAFGVLRVEDAKGIIRLRMGLPGRPLKLWQGAGQPMTLADFPCYFLSETPLSRGEGGEDFRISLKGLLWILDDSERMLTVVHPATRQVVFIPLPGQRSLDLKWYPDHLEVREESGSMDRGTPSGWSVPWVGLLPSFLRLSAPPPPSPQGTALLPYPAE